MTAEPAWLTERRDEALAHEPVITDDELVAGLTDRLDACVIALTPLLAREQTMRDHDDHAGYLVNTMHKLDVTIAECRALVDRHMKAGDLDAALNEKQRLLAAQSVQEDIARNLQTERDAISGYDFEAASRAISDLVTEREYIKGVLADQSKRAEFIAQKVAEKDAAQSRIIARAAFVAEMNDPVTRNASREAAERARTAAAVAQREADVAATRTGPTVRRWIPPKGQPILANGQRIGNPLEVGIR